MLILDQSKKNQNETNWRSFNVGTTNADGAINVSLIVGQSAQVRFISEGTWERLEGKTTELNVAVVPAISVNLPASIKTKTNLRVLAITNFNFIKQTLPKFNGENKDEIFDFFENYDVVLIKNTTYDVLCDSYYRFELINSWKRVMIDEAHEIITKIPSHINYHYLWLISATYTDILRKTGNNHYTIGMRDLLMDKNINLVLVKNNVNFIKNSSRLF